MSSAKMIRSSGLAGIINSPKNRVKQTHCLMWLKTFLALAFA